MSSDAAYPHKAVLEVNAKSVRHADALSRALDVEARDPLGGAQVRVARLDEGSVFTLEIDAVDLVHLRAAINSMLKWLDAADASLRASFGESAC
jgi:tRNA threonylcarbamoyladenosine modification (KEOPS) complex  Pcc1 subunit